MDDVGYKWVAAMIDPRNPYYDSISKTAILLSLEEPPDERQPFEPSVLEPPPVIDYALVTRLMKICGADFCKSNMKCFRYVAQWRGFYYRALSKFQEVHRKLADSDAYGTILDKEHEEILKSGESWEGQREHNAKERMNNLRDLYTCMQDVERYRKKREEVMARFSRIKYKFVQEDLPRLILMTKRLYKAAMGRQGGPVAQLQSLPRNLNPRNAVPRNVVPRNVVPRNVVPRNVVPLASRVPMRLLLERFDLPQTVPSLPATNNGNASMPDTNSTNAGPRHTNDAEVVVADGSNLQIIFEHPESTAISSESDDSSDSEEEEGEEEQEVEEEEGEYDEESEEETTAEWAARYQATPDPGDIRVTVRVPAPRRF